MSRLKEECGVFGIFNNKDASTLTALGLHALQHRGQEGCGIVTFDGKNFYAERRLGLVGDNFTKGNILEKLPGECAIGHNRYSTTGNNLIKNVQPFFADLHTGGIGIAHNGNLSNARNLRKELVKEGSIFHCFPLIEGFDHGLGADFFLIAGKRFDLEQPSSQIKGGHKGDQTVWTGNYKKFCVSDSGRSTHNNIGNGRNER